MQSPQLPIELCEHIIDWSRHTVRFGDAAVDYATLRACTLVCSAWLPRARHNLFLSVAVKSTRSLRDLAAGAAGCAWIRPRELQLTLPLRLSRARPNSKVARSGSGSDVDERPRDSDAQHAHDDDDANIDDANISLVHPAVAPALHAVSTLTLVRSEWLFPPRYIALFGAQLRDGLRELRLHSVFFVTARDLVQLLWGFPGLRVLDCFRAIVKFGDVATARLPPLPRASGTGDVSRMPCSNLDSLKVDSCSAASTLILKAATVHPANLTRVHIRSSFARWRPQDYAPLSTLVHLESLELVLASPTAFSPLPDDMDLIDLYQDATRRVLAALPVPVPVPTALASKSQRTSTSTLPGPLKSLSFTYEPGYGTRGELRGIVPWPAPAAGSLQQLQLQPEEEWPAAPPEARTWTYARCASDALAALLAAGFEDVLCERDGLRAAFGGLELLTLRLWDPYCVDDPWYDRQVQRGVPTLYALREVELRMDVRREPWDHTRSLWDPEDSELSRLKLGRSGSQTDSDA